MDQSDSIIFTKLYYQISNQAHIILKYGYYPNDRVFADFVLCINQYKHRSKRPDYGLDKNYLSY